MDHISNTDKLGYKQKYLKDISSRRKSAINHRLFDGSASIPLYHNSHKAQHSGGFSLTKVCLILLLCSLAACTGLLLLAQSHVEQLHGILHPATVAASNTVVNLSSSPYKEQQHQILFEQVSETNIPLKNAVHSLEDQPYVVLHNSIHNDSIHKQEELVAEEVEEVNEPPHSTQEAAKEEIPRIPARIIETGVFSLTTSPLVTAKTPNDHYHDSKAALMMPIRPSEDDYANLASFIAKSPPLNTTRLLSECMTMIRYSVDGYMANAFPTDELLPISCVGRNITGGIALSAIEALDTLILTRDFTRLRAVLIKLKAVWPRALDGVHMHGQFSGLSHSRKSLGALSSSSLVVSSSTGSGSGLDDGWDNYRVPIVDISQKALGGILSAHVLLEGIARKAGSSKSYDGELLKMAVELADRILPVFDTPSGLPLSTVSLLLPQTYTLSVSSSSSALHNSRTLNSISKTGRNGGGRRIHSSSMVKQSCSVCAIAPALEFGLLSHLTGNPVYKQKAFKAMDAAFRVKSKAGFIPQTLDADTGKKPVNKEDISDPAIGTSVTAFAATALKTYLMFGDSKYLHMYVSMFSSIIKYGAKVAPIAADHNSTLLYHNHHHQLENLTNTDSNNNLTFIVDVDAAKGTLAGTSALKKQGGLVWSGNAILSALAAFTGQLDIASKLYTSWIAGWDRYGWLPESFPADFKPTVKPLPYPGYALKGELAEVSYFMMSTTSTGSSNNNDGGGDGDGETMRENARQVGSRIQRRLREHNRGLCGFASVGDATTGELSDFMPSGFVSSTLKWLFLMWAERANDEKGNGSVQSTIAEHFIANGAGHLYTPIEGSNDDLIAAATSDEPPESKCYNICSPVGILEQQKQQHQEEEKGKGGKGGLFDHLEMSEKGGKLLKIRRCMACRELSRKLMQIEAEMMDRRTAVELRRRRQANEMAGN